MRCYEQYLPAKRLSWSAGRLLFGPLPLPRHQNFAKRLAHKGGGQTGAAANRYP